MLYSFIFEAVSQFSFQVNSSAAPSSIPVRLSTIQSEAFIIWIYGLGENPSLPSVIPELLPR